MLPFLSRRRVTTPTVLQMEATECGAASLAIVLGYFRRFVTLDEVRARCGVDRDGSNAANVLKAARTFGLAAKGYQRTADAALAGPFPIIVFWEFNHFLVVEGHGRDRVYLNDPALGPRTVSRAEFEEGFCGIVLAFTPAEGFETGGKPVRIGRRVLDAWARRGANKTVLALLAAMLVLSGVVAPGFTKIFVDEVLVAKLDGWAGPIVLGLALVVALRLGVSLLFQSILLRSQMQDLATRSFALAWRTLRLPVGFFANRYLGDIAMRMQASERIAQLVSRDAGGILLDAAAALFLLVMMACYEPRLALLTTAAAGANLFALRLVHRRRSDLSIRLLAEQSKLFGMTVVGLQTIETIKASGSEQDFFRKWAGKHAGCVEAEQKLSLIEHVTGMVPVLTAALATAAVLFVGALSVMDGRLTLGGLLAFVGLMSNLSPPLQRLTESAGKGQQAVADFERLADIEAPALDWRHTVPGAPQTPRGPSAALAIQDLSFAFGPLAPPFIQDFSLTIEPGRWVALVGSSGSGKSTIGSLVTGLLTPRDGTILLDGRPLHSWDREALSDRVARVDQEVRLFEGTVRDNITLWDRSIPEADVLAAVEDAALSDVLSSLPGGLDGRVEEDGRNLSGGQRQRLEIARALVRQPALIVLDEATSALDPVTELAVSQAIRRRGMTCLVVAHRLNTIRDCDEIIALQDGRISERGKHADLMARAGLYARLMQEV